MFGLYGRSLPEGSDVVLAPRNVWEYAKNMLDSAPVDGKVPTRMLGWHNLRRDGRLSYNDGREVWLGRGLEPKGVVIHHPRLYANPLQYPEALQGSDPVCQERDPNHTAYGAYGDGYVKVDSIWCLVYLEGGGYRSRYGITAPVWGRRRAVLGWSRVWVRGNAGILWGWPATECSAILRSAVALGLPMPVHWSAGLSQREDRQRFDLATAVRGPLTGRFTT